MDNNNEFKKQLDKGNVVYIHNYLQACKYIKHGLEPLKVEYDKVRDKIVFIFDKQKSQPLYLRFKTFNLD